MITEYKHPVSGEIIETNSNNYREEINGILEKGYEYHRSIPETVEDDDVLEGHCYPGHETWDD